jgi:VanZ family protein
MGKFVKYQLPACLWAILIFILSSIPRLSVPQLGVVFADKIFHFVVYLILGLLLVRAFLHTGAPGREQRAYLAAAILGVFWGLTDEVHQAFVRGRDASVYDLLADAAGVLCVVGAMWWRRRM